MADSQITPEANALYLTAMSSIVKDLGEAKKNQDPFTNRLNDSIDRLVKVGNASAKDSPMRVSLKDSYTNSLMAIGSGQQGDQVEKFTSCGLENATLNWMLWMSLYSDSWVFRTAIDKPAQDEVNCGLLIDDDNADKLLKAIAKSKPQLMNLLRWGALFGGSIALMMYDGLSNEDYAKPIDYNNAHIKNKVPRLYVTDRWYGVGVTGDKTVTDMSDVDFGKPATYSIVLADGTEIEVDHSYIIRYEHRDAPMFMKKGMLQGWGFAEGCHIFNELSKDEKLKASIQSLVDKSLIEVIKMSGMRGVFMGSKSADNQKLLQDRLEMVNWGRSFNSLTFLDKDDDYQEHGFSGLGGLAELLDKNMWQISAALEMQGVLYGNLTNGLSADTDALKRYDETIKNRCDAFYRPVLEKFIETICRSNTTVFKKVPEFEFGSLYKDQTDKDRMKGMSDYVDLLSKLLQDGIIDGKKYATALNDYTTKGNDNISFTDKELNAIEDNMKEQMENIDIDGKEGQTK